MKHMKPSQLRDKMHSLSQQMMDPDPSLRPPVPDLQEMGGLLDPSIRPIASGHGDAPRPGDGVSRSSRTPKGSGMGLKRKFGVDAKEKAEVKRRCTGVQPSSRLVS